MRYWGRLSGLSKSQVVVTGPMEEGPTEWRFELLVGGYSLRTIRMNLLELVEDAKNNPHLDFIFHYVPGQKVSDQYSSNNIVLLLLQLPNLPDNILVHRGFRHLFAVINQSRRG